MNPYYEQVRNNFEYVWRALELKGDWKPRFDQIAAAYTQEDRHYHNLQHLDACFHEMQDYRASHVLQGIDYFDEVEMALYLHDFVYDTKSAVNELESALWGAQMLRDAGADPMRIWRIFTMVMATFHSASSPIELPACQVTVDIDLSILGASPERFNEVSQAIRKEYAWVSEDLYRTNRTRMLNSFLQRERIYGTDYFFTKYEQAARRNLELAISELGDIHGTQ